MTNTNRDLLTTKLENLRTLMAAAVDIVEDVRVDVRSIEGDRAEGLIFWPLTRPTADRQVTDYSAWLERVESILRAL